MLKTFCKELVEYSIKSALCTIVTFATIGLVKGIIENSKEDKNEEK